MANTDPAVGPFTWDTRAKQYRDARGKFVSRREIRAALDRAIAHRAELLVALSEQLRAGEISGETWYVAMRQGVKDVHLYNAAAARGGWAQMQQQDYGRVGRLVREQYRYLNRFADQITNGLPLDGSFLRRAELYAEAGRRTYYAITETVMREKGATEERNVLHPAEHCRGCLEETARGWVDIGDLVPVGQRDCLGRCKCTISYR